ncbi:MULTISPECIES: hypothetical protein [unclassified Microcoleus]|nr:MULTISPECIES: hypothetical protein [unclassified Microcoleus]
MNFSCRWLWVIRFGIWDLGFSIVLASSAGIPTPNEAFRAWMKARALTS